MVFQMGTYKYLGLYVDNQLKFNLHVDYIKKKIQKRIGAMYRCKGLLPVKYRKMFANALMLPQFDYLDIIYNKAGKTKLAITTRHTRLIHTFHHSQRKFIVMRGT